eukprot:COSAG01_NODE_4363_length_5095_cov_2.354484_3_plen_93_part_00
MVTVSPHYHPPVGSRGWACVHHEPATTEQAGGAREGWQVKQMKHTHVNGSLGQPAGHRCCAAHGHRGTALSVMRELAECKSRRGGVCVCVSV